MRAVDSQGEENQRSKEERKMGIEPKQCRSLNTAQRFHTLASPGGPPTAHWIGSGTTGCTHFQDNEISSREKRPKLAKQINKREITDSMGSNKSPPLVPGHRLRSGLATIPTSIECILALILQLRTCPPKAVRVSKDRPQSHVNGSRIGPAWTAARCCNNFSSVLNTLRHGTLQRRLSHHASVCLPSVSLPHRRRKSPVIDMHTSMHTVRISRADKETFSPSWLRVALRRPFCPALGWHHRDHRSGPGAAHE